MPVSGKAYQLLKEKAATLQSPSPALIDKSTSMHELDSCRTPIWEALHRLDSEGPVTIVLRRGTSANEISITHLRKTCQLRSALEGFCARFAARRIALQYVEEVESVLKEPKVVIGRDWDRPVLVSDGQGSLMAVI